MTEVTNSAPARPVSRTEELANAGVSIWLDDLSRTLLRSGELAHLIERFSVTGVTTNPTILAAAIGSGEEYLDDLRSSTARGLSPKKPLLRLRATMSVRPVISLQERTATATAPTDGFRSRSPQNWHTMQRVP